MSKANDERKTCPGLPNHGNCPACIQCTVYNKKEETEHKKYLRLHEKHEEYEEHKRLRTKYVNYPPLSLKV